MQAAKDAIKSITGKHGHHDTTVDEIVAPAITQETITRQQKDEFTTAVDREVHQDHYHTSVQPITDSAVLPEQHHHKQAAIEERTFEHNDDVRTKERIAAEAAQFKDQTVRVEGSHTETQSAAVTGEHVHHHVHEVIQPVVNKQTIEPHVVHHTIPVHEVHHNAAQHHTTSTLPTVDINEFRSQGGVLDGRGERHDEFEGAPKNITESLTSQERDDVRNGSTRSNNTTSTTTNATNGSYATGRKASLLDKLNPTKDANGDGRKGIMT